MEMQDYLQAKADAIRRLRDMFKKEGDIEAKKKAERLLEELKKETSNEAGCCIFDGTNSRFFHAHTNCIRPGPAKSKPCI